MVLAPRTRVGAPQLHHEAGRLGQPGEFRLELGDGVPVAHDQQLEPEIRAQGQHPALGNAAAAVGDRPRELVDQASAVGTDGGNSQIEVHAAWRSGDGTQVYRCLPRISRGP